MPVDRVPISISQFAELLAIEPKRLIAVEVDRRSSTVMLVMEPEEDDGTNRRGTPSDATALVEKMA